MSETISLIVCLNYLWSFQTPPQIRYMLKEIQCLSNFDTLDILELWDARNIYYNTWHLSQVDIIQFGAATFSCWSKQIDTCRSYLQMHMFECMTNELYERNGSCLHLKEIIQFLKAYHYTLQYVDKFHFYVMYTKT